MKVKEMRRKIDSLFDEAHLFDGVEFLYLMMRVEGPKTDRSDYFVKLRDQLKFDAAAVKTDEFFKHDLLEFIANIINLASQRPYSYAPFYRLSKGLGRKPSLVDKLRFLIRKASEAGKEDLVLLLRDAYGPTIALYERKAATKKDSSRAHNACKIFTRLLLEQYSRQLLKYKGQASYIKIPGFQVFELLVDDETGLYGFYSHYPGDGKSHFIRRKDNFDAVNLWFGKDERVEPWVGEIPFEDEWKVDGKRLHELGLRGRYNLDGYWLPIIYPSNPEPLIQEAESLSDDPDVQGCLFYILATGFMGIEFVVRTNIHLPYQTGNIGGQVHLHRCLDVEGGDSPHNVQVYDGWFPLDRLDPDEIKAAIEIIECVINRLVLAYNGHAEWRIKYGRSQISESLLKPSVEALSAFNNLIVGFPSEKNDADVLDLALDWYRRGRSTANVFMKFLYFYISIESVASAIANGDASFGLGYSKDSKSVRKTKRRECVEELYKLYYLDDPTKFVTSAYFDCVGPIKKTTKTVASLVFGEGHEFVSWLFDDSERGKSLHKIRSDIAHGFISMLSREQELLVRKRVGDISQIANAFLRRLASSLPADQPLSETRLEFTSTLKFSDPRNTLVIRDPQAIVRMEDWRIRPEWVS